MLLKRAKTGLKPFLFLSGFFMVIGVLASGPTRNDIYEISADFSLVSYDGNSSEIYNELKSEGWELQCDAFEKTVLQVKEEIAKMTSGEKVNSLKKSQISTENIENAVSLFAQKAHMSGMNLNDYQLEEIYNKSICEQMNNVFTEPDYMVSQHFGYAVGENIINDRKVYVIAFRGTADTYSWIFTDFLAFPTEFLDTGTSVHVGFEWNRKTCMARNLLKDFIKNKILADTSNPLLIITGHSMGAALAVLETAYFIEKTSFSSKNIKLVTLAEPCPGRDDFVNRYKPQIKHYKWFCNLFDPVPVLPMIVKYKHFDYLSGLKMFSVGPKIPPIKNCFERHSLEYYKEYIDSLGDKNKI